METTSIRTSFYSFLFRSLAFVIKPAPIKSVETAAESKTIQGRPAAMKKLIDASSTVPPTAKKSAKPLFIFRTPSFIVLKI